MVNVHACGGLKMMQAAREAADQAARRAGQRPLVIAVTVLTSIDAGGARAIGVDAPDCRAGGALARLAQDAGLDGVVASPHEIGAIRARCGPEFQHRHAGHPQRARRSPATTRRAR